MYTLSFDFGSTNIKYLVFNITENREETNIKLVGKGRSAVTDFALFIYDILKEYHIDIKHIDKIVVTGTGSSFLGNDFEGVEIIKVDEFDAIAYGGLLLSKLDAGNIVSIGTGTTIIYSDLHEVKRLGGTGLGGGTLVGLGSAILSDIGNDKREITNFMTLIDMAKKGNKSNVDLIIGDINKGNIGNMTSDITAANFAATNKEANRYDYISALLNMILENIALLVKAVGENRKTVYIGTMMSDDYVRKCMLKITEYTKSDIMFVDNSEFAIVIGAWEYYLLNIRKNY